MTRAEMKENKLNEEKSFIESIKGKFIDGKLKEKFRRTSLWIAFRKSFYILETKVLKNGKKKDIVNIDYLTQNKLQKRFNLHHMKLDSRCYTDLNRDNFIPLNPQSHDFLHWFHTQCCKDKNFEQRFLELAHKMYELNDGKDVTDFEKIGEENV